ncbi:hypothetical protein GOBAR_AA10818 [Gossypium barbadense]|uniref:Uncharacterized protein n=1 Tax=Gossypium barbadense TaxID=3634 RepID=A0A2P5Y2I9_GOSBA|nr:hypothetical protein GOBAR_AA10818 [Gossypium barbadense]
MVTAQRGLLRVKYVGRLFMDGSGFVDIVNEIHVELGRGEGGGRGWVPQSQCQAKSGREGGSSWNEGISLGISSGSSSSVAYASRCKLKGRGGTAIDASSRHEGCPTRGRCVIDVTVEMGKIVGLHEFFCIKSQGNSEFWDTQLLHKTPKMELDCAWVVILCHNCL